MKKVSNILLIASFLKLILCAATVQNPTFKTTFDNKAEVGLKVILSSTTNSSETNTITYKNEYKQKPSIGIGITNLQSNYEKTTSSKSVVWTFDINVIELKIFGCNVSLNFQDGNSSLRILRISYFATSEIAIHISFQFQNFSSSQISTSNNGGQINISASYKQKSNSSNAVVAYTTLGIYTIRNTNTEEFDYKLSIKEKRKSNVVIALNVQKNNKVEWIRLCVLSYQKISINLQYNQYIQMQILISQSGTINDSSGKTISSTETIFTGISDFKTSDATSEVKYEIQFNLKDYTILNSSLKRVYTTYLWFRKLQCAQYFYSSGQICHNCDVSCRTCTDNSTESCLTCPPDSNRTFKNSRCQCKVNHIADQKSRNCRQVQCMESCQTCQVDNECSHCKENRGYILNGTSCICMDKYYDTGRLFCDKCDSSCLRCTNFSNTSCTACQSPREYVQQNHTCQCEAKYFKSIDICRACPKSCATCTNYSSCTSCNSLLFRQVNNSTGLCDCTRGTYDPQIHQKCQICPVGCQSCTSSLQCQSCTDNTVYELIDNLCQCVKGYFRNSSDFYCQECNYPCQTCSNAQQCIDCNSTLKRKFFNKTCICQENYYEDDGKQECVSCHFKCKTCSGPSNRSCLSCDNTTDHRQLSIDKMCICQQGYYQYAVGQKSCLECYFTCKTCNSQKSCLSCNGLKFRQLNGNNCECKDGYYNNGNEQCEKCNQFCLTCFNSSQCLTCDNSTRNTSNLKQCRCLQGFYDNGISSSCQKCQEECLTCTDGNSCSSCDISRKLTQGGTCRCKTGYLEPTCSQCSYQCQQCQLTSKNCINCNGTSFRYLNNNSCVCYDGYFSEGNKQECLPCQSSCQTCTNSSSCSSCPSNRDFNGSFCTCKSGSFSHSQNKNCLACHYSCVLCSQYQKCTECNSTKNRRKSDDLCNCDDGYFDYGNEQCSMCSSKCLTCSQYEVCDSCSTTIMYKNGTNCLCIKGYYWSSSNNTCLPCHYSCLLCQNHDECISCLDNRTKDKSTQKCLCQKGTYESNNSGSALCQACQQPCLTCTQNSNKCLSCDINHRQLVNQNCLCLQGTFQNLTNCIQCPISCEQCTALDNCSSCKIGSGRIENGLGACICNQGYHDEKQTLINCLACHYSCKTCSTGTTCDTCKSNRQKKLNEICLCPQQGFYDIQNDPNCLACHPTCLTCRDSSTNCTSCSTSNLRGLQNGSCVCKDGYYENPSQSSVCSICHYSCSKCHDNSSCFNCNTSNSRQLVNGPYCTCYSGTFDDFNNQLCQSCQYFCLSCSNSGDKCNSCDNSRNYLENSSQCNCKIGLYDNGTAQCQKCLYSCTECNNAIQCTKCPTTRNYLNKQCECKPGYYNVQQKLQCQKCSGKCQQCFSLYNCTKCDGNNTLRQLRDQDCKCQVEYYDQFLMNNTVCQPCNYTCQNCVNAFQCTSCSQKTFRQLNPVSHLCDCKSGYYNKNTDFQKQCLTCSFDCATCDISQNCITCKQFRTLNNTSKRCQCNNSYYQNGSICSSCPFQCETCLNYSYCTKCKDGLIKSEDGKCECKQHFYPVLNNASCQPCNFTCSSCISDLRCAQCNQSMHRYYSGSFCLCRSGYYSLNKNQQCQKCNILCKTCIGPDLDECDTCNEDENRQIYPNNTCQCLSDYYEDNDTCRKCNYTCLSCTSFFSCSSCDSSHLRELNNISNKCQCSKIGYFDNSSSICTKCSDFCLSCSKSRDECDNCSITQNRQLKLTSCVCKTGYFTASNTQISCSKCSSRCISCQWSSNNCTQCMQTQSTSGIPDCICKDGFYQNGPDLMCSSCDYRCQTCQNKLTCQTCNGSLNRTKDTSGMCVCPTQFYSIPNQVQCKKCSYKCASCQHPTKCVNCPHTRKLVNNLCICQDQYFDDGNNMTCQPCNYSCRSCLNSSSCTSCNILQYRYYDLESQMCLCFRGYYDSGTPNCLLCDSSCLNCTTNSSCDACPEGINKKIDTSALAKNNFCICKSGFYQIKSPNPTLTYTTQCLKCHYSCGQCFQKNTVCIECKSTTFRNLVDSGCLCQQNYYDNGNDEICIKCAQNCTSCFGNRTDQCTACNNESYLLITSCLSSCPDYYMKSLQSSQKICKSCTNNCISCPNDTTYCQNCRFGYLLYLINDTQRLCLSSCPQYYYESNNIQCQQCISPCLQCTSLYTCINCISKHYFKTYCFPCHSSCQSCTGSSAYDFTACIVDYALIDGLCSKLRCSNGEYVHSINGCISCSSSYPNSVSCTSKGINSCNSGYILSDSICQFCNQVQGYQFSQSIKDCHEICGDGITLNDLCDDGNILNGDGCSSVCNIEDNWSCNNSICNLISKPTIQKESMIKIQGQNIIEIYLRLSIGLRLVSGHFNLQFNSPKKYFFDVKELNKQFNRYVLSINYQESIANEDLKIKIISPINKVRILQIVTQLSLNLSLQLDLNLNTQPPAIYNDFQTKQIYKLGLLTFLAILHITTIAFAVIILFLQLRVMLFVIDAFNTITILYIIGGLCLFNVSDISIYSLHGLRPFIYQFGTPLSDSTSSFYFFNYTQLIFSSCLLQFLILLGCSIMRYIFNWHNLIWKYYQISFMYAFSFDIVLTCFIIFFWTTMQNFQAAYSMALSMLFIILINTQTVLYYLQVKNNNKTMAVLPERSYITAEVEQKNDNYMNIFGLTFDNQEVNQRQPTFKHDPASNDRINQKANMSHDQFQLRSDHHTEQKIEINQTQIRKKKLKIFQSVKMFDIVPKILYEETLYGSYITALHLPIRCMLLPICLCLGVQLQNTLARSCVVLLILIAALVHLLVTRDQSLWTIRNIKLLVLSSIYILIVFIQLLDSSLRSTQKLLSTGFVDISIIILVTFAMLWNLIMLIIELVKSQQWKQHLKSRYNQLKLKQNLKKKVPSKIYTGGHIKNIFKINETKKYQNELEDQNYESNIEKTKTQIQKSTIKEANLVFQPDQSQKKTRIPKKNTEIIQQIPYIPKKYKKNKIDLFEMESQDLQKEYQYDQEFNSQENQIYADYQQEQNLQINNKQKSMRQKKKKKNTKKGSSIIKKGRNTKGNTTQANFQNSNDIKSTKNRGINRKNENNKKINKNFLAIGQIQPQIQDVEKIINEQDLQKNAETRKKLDGHGKRDQLVKTIFNKNSSETRLRKYNVEEEDEEYYYHENNYQKKDHYKYIKKSKSRQKYLGFQPQNPMSPTSQKISHQDKKKYRGQQMEDDNESVGSGMPISLLHKHDTSSDQYTSSKIRSNSRGKRLSQHSSKLLGKSRGGHIHDISSIREENAEMIESGLIEEGTEGMTVFKKILQDYQVYKNKKVDRKLLKKNQPKI